MVIGKQKRHNFSKIIFAASVANPKNFISDNYRLDSGHKAPVPGSLDKKGGRCLILLNNTSTFFRFNVHVTDTNFSVLFFNTGGPGMTFMV
jgi:hypothetical protein